MQKLIALFSISFALFVASCNSKESHQHDGDTTAHEHSGTHTHDDGTEHADHADTTLKQEEFSVGADSVTNPAADTANAKKPHSHDGKKEHTH